MIKLIDIFKEKKTLILILTGLGMGIILAIIIATIAPQTPKIRPATPQLPPEAIPTPQISKLYDGKFKINLNPNLSTKNIPQSLPVFTVSQKGFSENEVYSLANNLGFSSKPFTASDAFLGLVYIFTSQTEYLRIAPSQQIIDYKTGVMPSDPIPENFNEQLAVSKSLDYLKKKQLMAETQNIEIFKVRTLSVNNGHITPQVPPNLLSVSFLKKVANFAILASSHETGIINVTLNGNNDIVSVYIDDIPSIESTKEYPARNLEAIRQTLSTEATIQSVNDGKIDLLDLDVNKITEINVNEISVAYIQEYSSTQNLLQPVYLMSGTAILDDKSTVSAILYLPALAPAAT